ncbi:Heterokaryon incompatibility Het-C [Penicillium paradoxum]|uniref:Heterokaryon incompatibility Het-C n=1 Tax=Penicillium paradoxum TaxID=176176 RepID=UPI002549A36E|nr:Heterokaryon incompatibility Het-C [Penicillium paradoxum]KAJ5782592.1 Heterokaryon incompatibility Het-C [Penicillium paradoxum]
MPLLHAGSALLVLLLILPQVHAFGAGNIASISTVEGKNWRHGDIEDVLKTLAFIHGHKWTSTMMKRVYFGNWLRDYSQAMDVGTLKNLQADTIRILVWVLSFLSFGYATGEFEVTSDRLGVYRPEEHIDNPKDYADNEDARQYDKRLRPPVRAVELEIDPQTGMKNYIANERGDWATSSAFIKFSLSRSIHYGRTYTNGGHNKGKEEDLCEALRCLGQGLHTLEDFAAHTNYVELVLREMGFHNVFPHTGTATQINLQGRRVFPLITGTFGMVDFFHSVLGEAHDHFTQSEVNEMDIALGNAESSAQSNNSLGALAGLLGKIPGTRDLVDEAENLKRASAAQATANRSRSAAMSHGQSTSHGYERSRAGPNEPSSGNSQPSSGLDGLPDFNPQETVAKIYPILAFRDKVMRSLNSIIEKIPGLESLVEKISETLTIVIMSLLAPFIRPLIKAASNSLQTGSSGVIDASGKHQYEPWTDPHCTDPTHSLLSKDHFANILNEPAGRVASAIVEYIAPRILYAWQHIDVSENEVLEDCLQVFHHPALRNMRNDAHRSMFEAVEKWARARPDRGASLDSILNSEGVRNGRNTGGVSHTHSGEHAGFPILGGAAAASHGQSQGHNQSHGSHGHGNNGGHSSGGFSSFFSQQTQQSSGNSPGVPWDKLSSLPIPGISNLSKFSGLLSGGLTRDEPDSTPQQTQHSSYQSHQGGGGYEPSHSPQPHGGYQQPQYAPPPSHGYQENRQHEQHYGGSQSSSYYTQQEHHSGYAPPHAPHNPPHQGSHPGPHGGHGQGQHQGHGYGNAHGYGQPRY